MNEFDEFNTFVADLNVINSFGIRRRTRKVYKIRFNPFEQLTDAEFLNKYRFTKVNMMHIVVMVHPQLYRDKRGGYIPVKLQVAAAIRSWARNEIQDDCADVHGFSQQTMSQIRKRVARSLALHANQLSRIIKMPESLGEQETVMANFAAIRGFPQVIGAIDCTHIKIRKIGSNIGQFYINRKGFYSLNVQVVGDANLRTRDIVAHWRGSTHDARIFRESRIKQRFESRDFQGLLLGDSGYPCSSYLYTPIINPRNTHEEAYNTAHIATRNSVERLFGVWKQRFWCLLRGMTGSLETIKTTIVALAVLHNLAIDFNEEILNDAAQIDSSEDTIISNESHEVSQTALVSREIFIRNNF